MSIGLLGKKIGMTRVYDDKGIATPVTVIATGGNRVLQVKTQETDGYSAVQVGFDDQKPQRVSKAELGHFKKSESTPKKFIREFRLKADETAPESADVPVTIFEVGQFVDVIGQSKGKGFQGVVTMRLTAPWSGQLISRKDSASLVDSDFDINATIELPNSFGLPTTLHTAVPINFLAREIASLRMRMNDCATRDFIRSELRELLEELNDLDGEEPKAKAG